MKNLITISAPSGAGKTTLCRALQKKFPNLQFSVSCTTRPRRKNEIDGYDYYFLTREEFDAKITAGELAEYENVHGELYGTLRSSLEEAIQNQSVLLLEVDVGGALSIKQLYPENSVGIFIVPPSLEALKQRLEKRGTDSPDRIKTRLARCEMEMSYKDQFDYLVVNDRMERALEELSQIIQKETKGVTYVS